VFSTAADNQPAVEIHVLQGEREMAKDNRTLGRFQLSEIPPAPRGTPQIEVTFDIDANGIVHVSAKDLKTRKEQKIKIEASSGLSDSDIEKMVKDAELHAEEDRKNKEVASLYNDLDNTIYHLEKQMTDSGASLPENIKSEINTEIANSKSDLATRDIEKMKTAKSRIEALITKYQSMFTQSAPQQESSEPQKEQKQPDEKVVDADFEEVKEDK